MAIVSPSILSADFGKLGADCRTVLDAGAQMLHYDVMDGHFVPNISFGVPVLKSMHKTLPDAFYDVHLMISHPLQYAEPFIKAGATLYNFHLECEDDIQQTLDAVQEMYEQKLVTYPRTDSQYLTDEMGESTETLIQMLFGKMPYAEGLEYQPDVSKVLNSKKVSDHHAIIPTVEVAKADIGELKERNCKILYLISARVLTATADPYIYEILKFQITCNYHTFYLTA